MPFHENEGASQSRPARAGQHSLFMPTQDHKLSFKPRPLCIAPGILTILLLGIFLSGCSSLSKPHRNEAAEKHTRLKTELSYISERRYVTSSIKDTWALGAANVVITLQQPVGEGSFPLIVYLPGLGESSEDGAAWRKTWAEAGYGVLSFQSVEDGESVFSSQAAKEGDFVVLAREHFSSAALKRRLQLMHQVFDELVKRHNPSKTSPDYSHLDLSKIAIAGFDLGSQTALGMAELDVNQLQALHPPGTIKCIIALSPYADFSGKGFKQQFESIQLPVLSVTSQDDGDRFGLVGSPSMRRVPFQYMPPGQKYLLSLADAPHTLISGKDHPGDVKEEAHAAAPEKPTPDKNEGSRGGRHRGGSSPQKSRPESKSQSAGWDTGSWNSQLTLIKQVTTAYLDALVKDDPVAEDWLSHDASRWVGDSAEFLIK
jgi:hypothetical protein